LERFVNWIGVFVELKTKDIPHWTPENVDIREACQLICAATAADDSRLLVADEECGSGSRVIVIKQFEDKSVAAFVTASGARTESGISVAVV
jgi:hypothetical protein